MTARSPHTRRGFTLIELMIVILLIGMIAGVTAPRLLPVLTMTEHEGEARRLVGYGRMAMAHSALTHKPIRVRIDLDRQEYWAEEMPMLVEDTWTTATGYDDEEDSLGDGVPEDDYELEQTTKQILRDDRKKDERFKDRFDKRRSTIEEEDDEELDPQYRDEEKRQNVIDEQTERMEQEFRAKADNSLYARALRVKHDDEWTDDDRFNLDRKRQEDLEDEEIVPEPLEDAMLAPHTVIETVWIDTVTVGEEEYSEGIVDIELSPLGLETEVTMALFNEDGDLMIVYWDPLSANAWYSRAEFDQ